MGLGGKKQHFSSMDHSPKMLRFGVRQLFQISLTTAEDSLCELATLRFARNNELRAIWIYFVLCYKHAIYRGYQGFGNNNCDDVHSNLLHYYKLRVLLRAKQSVASSHREPAPAAVRQN